MRNKIDRFHFIGEIKYLFPDLTEDLNAENSMWLCEQVVIREFILHRIRQNDSASINAFRTLIKDQYQHGDKYLKDGIKSGIVTQEVKIGISKLLGKHAVTRQESAPGTNANG